MFLERVNLFNHFNHLVSPAANQFIVILREVLHLEFQISNFSNARGAYFIATCALSHHACRPFCIFDVSKHLLKDQIALHVRHFKLLPYDLRIPPFLRDLLPKELSLFLEHLQHVLLLLLLVLLDSLDVWRGQRGDVFIEELSKFDYYLSG